MLGTNSVIDCALRGVDLEPLGLEGPAEPERRDLGAAPDQLQQARGAVAPRALLGQVEAGRPHALELAQAVDRDARVLEQR